MRYRLNCDDRTTAGAFAELDELIDQMAADAVRQLETNLLVKGADADDVDERLAAFTAAWNVMRPDVRAEARRELVAFLSEGT